MKCANCGHKIIKDKITGKWEHMFLTSEWNIPIFGYLLSTGGQHLVCGWKKGWGPSYENEPQCNCPNPQPAQVT